MLQELARVFVCLAVGEAVSRLGLLPFPGPVVGLVLLYASLEIGGRLPDELGKLANAVLGMLGMLFVPAGVGVLAYLDLLRMELVPIAVALVGGTVVTVLVTAYTADRLAGARTKRGFPEPAGGAIGTR